MFLERPNAGDLDGAAQLLASARARLAAAAADLALAEPMRLTEWQRTTIAALLGRLIGSIEDELRSALIDRLGGQASEAAVAALSSARVPIAGPLLESTGTLSRPELVSALLRRAEEHRLQRAIAGEHSLLVELAGDGDEAVAAEAMTLLVAQSSRLDRFQEPLIARTDLPAELEHALVWAVAAALRTYLIVQQDLDAATVDGAVAAAAAGLLAGYDEGESFDARCLRLARTLHRRDRLGPTLLPRALREGSLPLLLAMLAVRTGIAADAAWEVLSEPSGRGTVLLLRASGAGREEAAAVLVDLQHPEPQLAARLDLFDGLSEADAERLFALWRADPAYRAAVASLLP